MPPPAVILARGAEAGRLKMSDTRPPEDLQRALQAAGYQRLTRAEWAKFRSNGRRRLRDLLATRRPTKALSIVVKMRPQLQEPQAEEWEEPPAAEEPPAGEEPWEQEQEHWEDPPAAEEPWEPAAGAEDSAWEDPAWTEPGSPQPPQRLSRAQVWTHTSEIEEWYGFTSWFEIKDVALAKQEQEALIGRAQRLRCPWCSWEASAKSVQHPEFSLHQHLCSEAEHAAIFDDLDASHPPAGLMVKINRLWNDANPREASRKRRRKER